MLSRRPLDSMTGGCWSPATPTRGRSTRPRPGHGARRATWSTAACMRRFPPAAGLQDPQGITRRIQQPRLTSVLSRAGTPGRPTFRECADLLEHVEVVTDSPVLGYLAAGDPINSHTLP